MRAVAAGAVAGSGKQGAESRPSPITLQPHWYLGRQRGEGKMGWEFGL